MPADLERLPIDFGWNMLVIVRVFFGVETFMWRWSMMRSWHNWMYRRLKEAAFIATIPGS